MPDVADGPPDSRHRITHVGVCVTDLDRSIAFYRDGLGMVEVGRLHAEGEPTATLLEVADLDLELVYLERDGLRIELLGYAGGGARPARGARPMDEAGLTHLSIRAGDLDALMARLVEAGGRVVESTEVSFARGNRGIMVLDPDGLRVELIEEVAR